MLSNIVANQNFELIRDAIGRVLTAEIANQNSLIAAWNLANPTNLKETIECGVWIERYEPFTIQELPAINIVLVESTSDAENTSFSTVFDNKYMVECYTHSYTSDDGLGTTKAALQLAKLTGWIRSILMNSENLYLDFIGEKFIRSRKIQSIARTSPRLSNESEGVISGIIELHYDALEVTELGSGTLEGYLETTVKLHETEKGYQFIIEN